MIWIGSGILEELLPIHLFSSSYRVGVSLREAGNTLDPPKLWNLLPLHLFHFKDPPLLLFFDPVWYVFTLLFFYSWLFAFLFCIVLFYFVIFMYLILILLNSGILCSVLIVFKFFINKVGLRDWHRHRDKRETDNHSLSQSYLWSIRNHWDNLTHAWLQTVG